MKSEQPYPIGQPGVKWGEPERAEWFSMQAVKRRYSDEVLARLDPLNQQFSVKSYGALSIDPERYPLYVLKSRQWNNGKPAVLVTGGVHGYETSGVQGAIRFLETAADRYTNRINVIVAPCVSPWGYETINRWNPGAVDPNRSFRPDSPSEEARFLMRYLDQLDTDILVHIDLHETTDTDNSEFRPALAARDGVTQDNWNIPDGFYLVGNTSNPVPDFQKAMIASVEQVTHIAPPDENGKIIGAELEQWGVINYAARDLGLCMGMTDAEFVTTTEVYPDSPRADDENCIAAQVAAVTGGLDYVCTHAI